MANWAGLQEEMVGLPVHKRAKYGIHFDKGGGEILAEFTGKPCHFQENGIWKPIDTALLATADGWYSSPHSDVVIRPDGRVRVKNSDYQQFTELPSAKAGKLAGDRVIRTFPGGEQHLIMKEDGFREEIHVFKPTFKIEKFIAKTTGKLPGKYKAHPITAEDAEGNTYEFTGDVKEFGAWLDKAVYPVVIDPDLVLQPDEAAAQDTFFKAAAPDTAYGTDALLRTKKGGYISALKFDFSSLPSGVTISNVVFQIINNTVEYYNTTISLHRILAANDGWTESSTWNYKTPSTVRWAGDAAGDGGADAGCSVSGTDWSATLMGSWTQASGDAIGTIYSCTLSNLTEFGLMVTNNYGFCIYRNETHDVFYRSSNYATASQRPKMTITYGAGVPKHFMHYQRMRSL